MAIKMLRQWAAPALSLLLLCIIAAAAVAYGAGLYDISFIERPSTASSFASPSNAAGASDAQTGSSVKKEGDNLSLVFDPEQIASAEGQAPAETSAPFSRENTPQPSAQIKTAYTAASLKAAGYRLTDTDYSQFTHKLGLVSPGVQLTGKLSQRSNIPALRVYMGYIIYDSGAHMYALNSNGAVSVSGIDSLSFAYVRDAVGHPLFTSNGKYYYLIENSGKMAQVAYDPLYAPVLKYDSPASYGRTDAPLQRFYVETVHQRKIDPHGNDVTDEVDNLVSEAEKEGKDITDPAVYAKLNVPKYTLQYRDCILWGYMNSYKRIAIEAKYYFASDFDENGIAAVADSRGKLQFIDTYGNTVYDPSGAVLYLAERNRRPAVMGYYLPKSFGLESIGMFTFDHNLMRVRRCLYDYYRAGELVREEDILINADGGEFPIPQGYSLKGYSDGVLLLEKDGKYGFLDRTGRWIAQPVFTYAQPFLQGLAVIGMSDGRRCMIDASGNIVLPYVYDYISNASSGVIVAHSAASGWSIFNIMTK